MAAGRSGAVASIEPALDDLELITQARDVRHEHQPTLGNVGGVRISRSVRKTTPHDPRCPTGRSETARVCATNVREQRTHFAMGVAGEGESVVGRRTY